MTGLLEHLVELSLHQFPDAVAPGLDDHAAAHVGIFRHVGGGDDGLIPLGEIVGADRADGVGRGFAALRLLLLLLVVVGHKIRRKICG